MPFETVNNRQYYPSNVRELFFLQQNSVTKHIVPKAYSQNVYIRNGYYSGIMFIFVKQLNA